MNDSDVEEIIRRIENKKLSFSKLEVELGNSNLATLIRRIYLEKKLGINLSSIASTILDFEELYGRNIENPIGGIQIPLGVVGPLIINGEYAKGEYYVPLATTEGALVASVSRGIKAITLSGGANTRIILDGMTRAPLLRTNSVNDATEFIRWINDNVDKLKDVVREVTRFGELIDIFPYIIGNLVWLRLRFKTGDAMGMNIATLSTDKICNFILENYPSGIECLSISGNLCSDKKPAIINRILGRGKFVIAEAFIKEGVVREVLKTNSEKIYFINITKNLLGSAAAGSPSYNAHVANIIAAIFLATGQDVAQVVESSLAFTWVELRENGLYISVTLPSLEVGTVGGGTRLPTQREALSILGVQGGGRTPGENALKFAEIIAATVLGGELSLLASLAESSLARAHKLFGRGGVHGRDKM